MKVVPATLHVVVSFQLIVYSTIKITERGTAMPLYEFNAKQPRKELKNRGKIFFRKMATIRDGPIISTETRKG